MANHAVVIANKMVAKDVDSYVRPVIAQQDIDNGNIFSLTAKSSTAGESEVWDVVVPTTGSLTGLWMALEPELPFLKNGTRQYNGLGTIQDFYTAASTVFTAVKLSAGDIITLTAEAFASGSTLGFGLAKNGKFTWTGAAAITTDVGAVIQYLGTTYIPSADGAIASGRIAAYQYQVLTA
jgi:hypothetical protein